MFGTTCGILTSEPSSLAKSRSHLVINGIMFSLNAAVGQNAVTSPVQPRRSLRCGQSVGISKKLSRWLHWMFCCKRFTRLSEQVK